MSNDDYAEHDDVSEEPAEIIEEILEIEKSDTNPELSPQQDQ